MRKIGILTSGGDSPGMNACIRAVTRVTLRRGLEAYGIRRGYAGLLEGEVQPMERTSVSNVIQRGGTMLGTARTEEFKQASARRRAAEILQQHGIDGLVVIGGEGSLQGAHLLDTESGGSVRCVGVPGTIDNDVFGTDRSLGFDTALNTALMAIDRIRETAESNDVMHFVEVMGRHSGWIALGSGVAGGAEAVLLPEQPATFEELVTTVSDHVRQGKRGVIVVVAEGSVTDSTGTLAQRVAEHVDRPARVTTLGHLQRGGSPTAADRILGSRLGAFAVDALCSGRSDVMVGDVGGKLTLTPLEHTWTRDHALDEELVALVGILH